MRVSVIIVFFNNKDRLLKTIDSINTSKSKTILEIIVVNNSKTKLKLPGVQIIKSPRNLGYGAGNNLGAKYAKGKYLFILNPDTIVFPGSIDVLVNFLESNSKAGIVAPVLVDKYGKMFSQVGERELTPLRGAIELSFLNNYLSKRAVPNKLREVDTAAGSAFMIRKEVFEKAGRFDENFFLFFEENDLGIRVRKLGYKLFINPLTRVQHFWEKTDADNKKYYFKKSRFYYFRKHFGLASALLVETFARFSKTMVVLLFILTLASFLRFFRLEQNLVFHGELGHNYLAIKNFWYDGKIPLLGPPTSHSWLSFGPLYYWVFSPVLALWGFNPISGAYFFAGVGVLLVLINFVVFSDLLGRKFAVVSSSLIAISPLFVSLARESRFFSLTVVFFYPLFWSLIKKKWIWASFFWGLMLNFHLTPIIFFPVFIYLFIKEKLNLRKIILSFLALLFTQIPVLIYGFSKDPGMLKNFALWVPYRIAGFFGAYPKNTLSLFIFKENLVSLFDFFTKSIAQRALYGSLAFLATFIYLFFKKQKGERNKILNSLLLIFAFSYLGIFIHGNPPNHYYLPIYPIPILLFSYFLSRFWPKVIAAVLFLICIINLRYYFSQNWFYISPSKISETGLVPYKLQLDTVGKILNMADRRSFSLEREGPGDEFDANYAQNYHYLLWWLGNEPRKDSKLTYTVVEKDGEITIKEAEK